MPYPSPFRSSLSVLATLLGLVVLLSCQNDVTGPQTSSKVVTGRWPIDPLRLPDSAAWATHDTSGAFVLTVPPKDTTFTVQAILPRAMGPNDTLVLSLFTLSLRTTVAPCKADGNGNLSLWATSVQDSTALHLLKVLDSLRKKDPSTWGTSSDPLGKQIASLQVLYANLILSKAPAVTGFPAKHPVGIDSLAVVDQILILASKQKLTLGGLDSLVALDSAGVHREVHKLGLAGKIDTTILFPLPPFVPNSAPSFSGVSDISRTFDTTAQVVANWITAISAGSKNEASQSVRFEVAVDSDASLFSALPTVDSSGTLRYQAKSAGKGVFRVRAHDNGGTTNGGVDTSAWVGFSIQLSTKAVLTISGIPSTLQMVEDSLLHISVTLYGADSATLRLVSGDTALLGSQNRTVRRTDTLALQAKPDANGGPVQIVFLLQGNGLADTVDAVVTVAPRNDPPTFAGATDISRTLDATSQVVANWITAISAGSKNEASQSVRFEVAVDSGASLFSALPTVDSSGTLRYQAKSAGKGVFQVRAHDNGDSVGSNVNVSTWKAFAIQLFSRPVLIATGPTDTVRLVEDSATTVSFAVQNFVGSSLSVKFTPVDTSLILAHSWTLVPDANGKVAITLQGKPDAFGGPVTTIVTLTDSLDASNLIVPITIAARNHPPTFGGASNLVVTASATLKSFPSWIDSISSGPANESYQKVSFQVQVVDGASLFATLPSVDASGMLSFAGNANSSGLAHIQVRAVDNDSVDPGNRYSAWKTTSVYFNQAPTLMLPNHSVSIWENQSAVVGAATVSDQETSPGNLNLTWTVSDTTILPVSGVIATSLGTVARNITLHPVAHCWGSVNIVFTITDSLGATAADSLTLTVNPVNHAPTIKVRLPTFVYSYKGEHSQSLATMKWDDAATSQSGRVDIRWPDTLLVRLRVDSLTGALFAVPKFDTSITIKFQVRAHDNGDTLHGGVDTSTWSDSIPLQIVDTVQDAQGNDYRVKVMGSQTWMTQNVRASVNSAVCAWGDCQTYGRLYLWNQVMSLDGICNTTNCSSQIQPQHQGICPVGWHVPRTGEWKSLAIWGGNGDSALGINRLKSGGSIWSFNTIPNSGANCGYKASPGYFGFDLYPSSGVGTVQSVGGGTTVTICSPSANYWAISLNNRSGAMVLGYGTYGGVVDSVTSDAFGQFRCMKNFSERPYYGVAP